MENSTLTISEKGYLTAIAHYGGVMDTRKLRDGFSKYRSGKDGMSALGGVCKVLKRLERKGFLSRTNREQYEITKAGLDILKDI